MPPRKRPRVLPRLEGLERRETPAIDYYIGPHGGGWHVDQHWLDGSAPTQFDDVVLSGAYSNGDCVYIGGPVVIAKSVTMEASYGGNLHLQSSGPITIGEGGLHQHGGNVVQQSDQDLVIQGHWEWTGGDLRTFAMAPARIWIGGGGNWAGAANRNIESTVRVFGAGALVINTAIAVPGQGEVTFAKNTGMEVVAGSSVTVIQGRLVTTGTGAINNAGTFTKSTGAVNTSSIDLPFINSAGGKFELLGGTLTLGVRAGASGYSYYQTGGTMELNERTECSVETLRGRAYNGV